MEKIPQKGGINIGIEGDDRADDGPGDVLFSYALVFAIEGKAGPFLVDGPPFFEAGDIKKRFPCSKKPMSVKVLPTSMQMIMFGFATSGFSPPWRCLARL